MKKIFFFIAIIFSLNICLAQSGFVREKNNLFAKVDYSFYSATNFKNFEGKSITTAKFKQKAILLYAEYGIAKKLALHALFPIFKQNGYKSTNTVSGIGDVKLEVKYALLTKKFPVAISVAPEFTTGKKNLFATNKSDANQKINLPTSDGEFNVWTTLAASHSFYPKKMYINVFSAINFRSSYGNRNFQNQSLSGAEFGFKIKNKCWVSTKLNVLSGIGKKPQFADFIRSDGTAFTAFILNGLYEIKNNWGITAQYFNCNNLIVKTKNTYEANIFSVGLVYQKHR